MSHGGFVCGSTRQTSARPDSTNWNWGAQRDKQNAGALEPRLHVGRLVGAVVVHHQVQSNVSGEFRLQATQEFQKLLMAVAHIARADDFALQDLQGGEQTGGPLRL